MVADRTLPTSSSLVIIGAGPIGLETAALAASEGIDFVVLEKGAVGDNIRKWGHVRLFSPFAMNHSEAGLEQIRAAGAGYTPPDPDRYLTGHEFVDSYLEPLARSRGLAHRIFAGQRVEAIGRDRISKQDLIGNPRRCRHPFRILIRNRAGQSIHQTQAIVDASGVYSTPRTVGNGGVPAPGEAEALERAPERIHFGVADLQSMGETLRGQSILLVGSGQSAATHLADMDTLAEKLEWKVTWIWRRPERQPYTRIAGDPLPDRDRQSELGNRLALHPPPWLACFPGSTVEAIRVEADRHLEIKLKQNDRVWDLGVDHVLACVGFQPDATLYRQLQVHECYATQGPMKLSAALLGASADCLEQETQGIDTLRNPEPHFYVIGNKSYGTASNFLLSNGIDQARTVMTELVKSLGETSSPDHA